MSANVPRNPQGLALCGRRSPSVGRSAVEPSLKTSLPGARCRSDAWKPAAADGSRAQALAGERSSGTASSAASSVAWRAQATRWGLRPVGTTPPRLLSDACRAWRVPGMLATCPGRSRVPSTGLVLAVGSGVAVIAVAGAVVLVLLLVTVSMRGRQKRGAQRRGEARRDADASRERAERAEHGRDSAREGEEEPGRDR